MLSSLDLVKARRPVAIGIISLGAGLGGIVFPIMFRSLVPNIGYVTMHGDSPADNRSFPWTVRTFGFMNFTLFLVANLVRVPVW